MKNFKGLKRTLNKTMAMLTLCAVLISCVGVMSASADVAPGNVIYKTIDDLFKQEGVGQFGNDYPLNYYVPAAGTYNALERDGMGLDYENGESGNVVVYSGNGTTIKNGTAFSGTFGFRGMFSSGYVTGGFETQKLQKWEAKVKLSATTDKVYAFAYDRKRDYLFGNKHTSWAFDGTNVTNTGVLFDGSKIWLADLTGKTTSNPVTYDIAVKNDQGEEVVTAKDTWYKIVRYMDFTNDTQHMSKTFIYKVEANGNETLISASKPEWLMAGTEPISNGVVRTIGFDVAAASGPVMIDDLAAYNWEAAPKASFARADYNTVGTFKNGTTINTAVSSNGQKDLPTDNDWNGFMGLTTYGKVAYGYENADNENAVLKTGDGTDHRGAWVFRNLGGQMGGARKAKWELKVKLADAATDVVNVLAYDELYTITASNYASAKTPVLIYKGVAKVYDGTANSWKVLCDGLESGVWYKVVRYMDFSTANVNKSRSQIFRVNADETETLLGDTVSFLVCGTMPYTSGTMTMRTIGADASTASGSIMFDDMFVYEIETFDLPTTNVSVDLGKVVACFDTAMDATTFDKTAVTLSANGTNVPLKKDAVYDETTNAITVEFNTLQYETDYTLTIAKNVMKAKGGLGFTPDADAVYTFTTEEDPFSISELAFKDAAGADLASVTALNKGATVKGCATLVNTSAKTRSYNLILAIYKGDEMTNLISKPGTIVNTTEEGTTIETDALTIADDGSRAELFVWDSWEGLRPLTEKDVIPTPAA